MVRGWARSDGLDDDSPAVRRLLSYSDAVHDDLEQVWRPFTERFAKFALAG
jgi:hypothetical protein